MKAVLITPTHNFLRTCRPHSSPADSHFPPLHIKEKPGPPRSELWFGDNGGVEITAGANCSQMSLRHMAHYWSHKHRRGGRKADSASHQPNYTWSCCFLASCYMLTRHSGIRFKFWGKHSDTNTPSYTLYLMNCDETCPSSRGCFLTGTFNQTWRKGWEMKKPPTCCPLTCNRKLQVVGFLTERNDTSSGNKGGDGGGGFRNHSTTCSGSSVRVSWSCDPSPSVDRLH